MSINAPEVGSCDLCGQEMIRTDDDCWHPWDVRVACPPEPPSMRGGDPAAVARWQKFYESGLRTGRPGRDHFVPALIRGDGVGTAG